MIVSMWIATVILGLAVALGLVRVFTAPDAATKAVVGDLVYFACVGILIIQGMLQDSAVAVDAAMIASILGIIATVALARILTRGRR